MKPRTQARVIPAGGGDVWKKSWQDRQEEPRRQQAKLMLSIQLLQGTIDAKFAEKRRMEEKTRPRVPIWL